MSPLPDLRLTGRQMYANTATLPDSAAVGYAEPETDYAWARFIDALSHLLDPIAEVTRPEDGSDPWTPLADPWRCPPEWLPVLAQWAGVRRWDRLEEYDLRELISTGGGGFWRGTRRGMEAQVRRFYAPELRRQPPIYWEERADGQPYALRVFTYDWVVHDPALVRRQLELSKPAGLFPIIYEVRVGQTWSQMRVCNYTYWQVDYAYQDWRDVYKSMTLPPQFPCRPTPDTPQEPVTGEYSTLIRAAKPIHYWRLNELIGNVAWDQMPAQAHGVYRGTRRSADGIVLNTTAHSMRFDGGYMFSADARRPVDGTIEFWTALDQAGLNALSSGLFLGEDDPDIGALSGPDGQGIVGYWDGGTAEVPDTVPLGDVDTPDGIHGHHIVITFELLGLPTLDGGDPPSPPPTGIDNAWPDTTDFIPPPINAHPRRGGP